VKTALTRPTATSWLRRLIEAPDLVDRVRTLEPARFSLLVRHVGVEDAGELVALATTEQLVTAFDEDLFQNERPGEEERFDADRFVVWLEVLREAGDEVLANRVAELSEDFVVHALSSLLVVLDHDALRDRFEEGDDDARYADKAIESSLSEELDSWLLVAKRHDGWDAALAVVVALDRDHRAFLERVLDRLGAIGDRYVDDPAELTSVLTAAESLAEDVAAEREDRRSRLGYVEPRAAKSFLALALRPLEGDPRDAPRDPVTRAYFRDLDVTPRAAPQVEADARRLDSSWVDALSELPDETSAPPRLAAKPGTKQVFDPALAVREAMRRLGDAAPHVFAERIEELAYLTNVLVAGDASAGERLDPAAAAEVALVTVGRGALIAATQQRETGTSKSSRNRGVTSAEIEEALRTCHADVLFRLARSQSKTKQASNSTAKLGKTSAASPSTRRRVR